MDSESVSMLPGEAKPFTKGPSDGLLNFSNQKVAKYCDLSFTIRTSAEYESPRGFSFRAKVDMLGRLDCNPFTRDVIRGEQWYKGMLHICADPSKGITEEYRAFVYESTNGIGMLAKRGLSCRLTQVLPSGIDFKEIPWSFID